MENTEKSGGTRFSAGKPSGWWYGVLYGLRLVARVWERGAEKYAPMDWKAGQSFSTLLDCAMRHSLEVMHRGPWAKDAETGCYHAAHACWNWLCLLTFMEDERHDLDDVTPWFGVTAATKDQPQVVDPDLMCNDERCGECYPQTAARRPPTPEGVRTNTYGGNLWELAEEDRAP